MSKDIGLTMNGIPRATLEADGRTFRSLRLVTLEGWTATLQIGFGPDGIVLDILDRNDSPVPITKECILLV